MYLELRPDLRRLYVAVPELDAALAALAPLGFAPLPGDPVDMGDGAVWTLVNDFGPDSIDGWLGDVVLRELTADEPSVIDETGRRLVLDDRVIDLSPLELGLLQYLERKKGAAVTREELLREVWGHEWIGTSSNVVEAVVSGLRRKLGVHADVLETVRGVGYRLGPLS